MRQLTQIHGGVHPPFHKEESTALPIKDAGIPAQLILPLQQHIGAPAEPVVAVGDKVLKGQLIAVATHDKISANIHAPSSGVISAIEDHSQPHPSNLAGLCIIINTDGKDEWLNDKNKLEPLTDYTSIKVDVLLERIQQAGIVGLGGAVFPTAVKMAGANQSKIDTFIINAAECEPFITCDDRLMRERSEEIVAGIRIVQHLVKPTECLIGIEDNKPEAILAMQQACKDDTHIDVITIPTIYPSGGEKQLINILTGKEVPADSLPLDIGILGQNVGTAYSIYQAVIKGKPLISRTITVTGNGVQHPQNFETLIGTPFSYLAEQAGGYTKMADHLIMGGPMMGFALNDDSPPIVKATNCALFISNTALAESNSSYADQPTMPCIRCSKCMDVCPVNLLPQQMYWHIRAKDFPRAEAHNLKDCIECGCCSYVCPSHIPLVDYYRFAKNEIREQQQDQQNADKARERHEFLLFRKERDKRERDEKRAAHKAALQKKKAAAAKEKGKSGDESDPKADAIKAAMERAKVKKAKIEKEKESKKEELK